MKLDVTGIGVAGAFGRGVPSLANAIGAGPIQPATTVLKYLDRSVPTLAVNEELLQDPLLRPARRAGRFIKMAMLAASDCLAASALSQTAKEQLGIVLVTGMGAHDMNFTFVDGLLDFGMDQGSPINFSHSVHNAAAAYVATMLHTHGPVFSLTHFACPVHQGLDAAAILLESGSCDNVLLGAVDELGQHMLSVYAGLGMVAAGGQLHPGALQKPSRGIVPGEGASFFLLSKAGTAQQRVARLSFPEPVAPACDLMVLDHDGLGSKEATLPAGLRHMPAICCNSLWGSYPSGTGMALATAVCLLSPGSVRPSPAFMADSDGLEIWSGQPAPTRICCHTHRPGAQPITVEP